MIGHDPRGDLPLFAWGEELRRRKAARRRLLRWISLVGGLIGATIGSIFLRPGPRLLWNASASVPVGLYAVALRNEPHRGDMVVAWAPSNARALAAARHYLPADVPLIKPVAAVAGDTVCASGPRILIDGEIVARRRVADRLGRPLPWWAGCRLLREGDLLLLASGQRASFDGRYFGLSRLTDTLGTARPLWVQ